MLLAFNIVRKITERTNVMGTTGEGMRGQKKRRKGDK